MAVRTSSPKSPIASLLTPLACAAALVGAFGCAKRAPSHEYASATAYDAEMRVAMAEGENYAPIDENAFLDVAQSPMSTFSIDVDTASYSNVRRFIHGGSLPPPDAVRIEELINYFAYDYPKPTDSEPFSFTAEVADCPWNDQARLVHLGLQGQAISDEELPPRNLVFLLDVSGSMGSPDKLPLLRRSMKLVVDGLDQDDHVAIVVYAGASGVVLEPTSGAHRDEIFDALDRLQAGGSTNGGEGIERAYDLARQHFDPRGINRVILATDGDFNVGTTTQSGLERLITEERESGVFLSVLGFGTGNLQDAKMEMLADKGNGNYAYIDSISEARKVLVQEAGATLVTIAKDVKVQAEFNPELVASYRLIGYENRLLDDRDFEDDTKDAGEIGAGHTVTALYEVIPAQAGQPPADADTNDFDGALMQVRLRYKAPSGDQSQLVTFPIHDEATTLDGSSDAFRFSAAVAQFGMLLRQSEHAGDATYVDTLDLAKGALGQDTGGYRSEFIQLVGQAAALDG